MAADADKYRENSSSDSGSSMGFGMWATIKSMQVKFPNMNNISTEACSSLLSSNETNENIVIFDCRSEAEYNVSHLSGAQRIDWKIADPQQLLHTLPQDKPCICVCYCSLGYRSSAVAEKIMNFIKDVKMFNLLQKFLSSTWKDPFSNGPTKADQWLTVQETEQRSATHTVLCGGNFFIESYKVPLEHHL